jgi:sec-independent protein translocase protein TatA
MAGSVSAPAVRSDGPDRRRGLSLFRNPVTDAVVALVVLLVIFGPKRLPMLGRSLGEGIRGFRESISGRSSHEAQDAPILIPAQATGSPTPGVTPTQASPEQ